MIKKLFLTLLVALAIGNASARYKGTAPTQGQQYYLLSVYQSKFLTTDGLLITDKQGTPTLYTATSGTAITIDGANYSIAQSNYGYTLSSARGALMFDKGSSCKVDNINTGYNLDCAQWLFITPDEYAAMQAKPTFTTCALNVDGMPKSVTVAGVYEVKLNPDAKEGPGATAIGAQMRQLGYDVVGLSEDFNYHTEIMNAINDGGKLYTDATHRGVISAGLGAVSDYLAKRTIFDTDGLGLLVRDAKASFSNESWTKWSEHYGYDNNGADGLINKGYRYYLVTLTDGTEIDLYILHMDAETDPGDNAARETQMKQLATAIKATSNKRPIIVMGDTNCRYTRDPLKTKFIDLINADNRFTCRDAWIELCRDGRYPAQNGNSIMVGDEGYRRGEVVDKVFYINNTESDIRIEAEQFRQDISFIGDDGEPLADHWPMVVDFSYHTYDPAIDDVPEQTDNIEGVYLRNRATGQFLRQGGHWGTHATQGVYGSPMNLIRLSDGKYLLASSAGYVGQGDPYMDTPNEQGWTLMQHAGYYIFAYDNGTMALTAKDAYVYQPQFGPNTRYVTCQKLDTSDPYQQWEMLTTEQLLAEALMNASSNQPYDLTFMLPGAGFDRNDSQNSAWTRDTPDSRTTSTLGDGFHSDGHFANYVGEVFVGSCSESHGFLGSCKHYGHWTVEQQLKGLPNGSYRVSCQAFQRISNGPTTTATINFFAGDQTMPVALMYSVEQTEIAGGNTTNGFLYPDNMSEAAQFFNAGHYKHTLDVTVTDGTLRIGLEKTSDTGKSNSAWTCFDNFQLIYLGDGRPYEHARQAALDMQESGSRAIASALASYPEATQQEAEARAEAEGYDVQTAIDVLRNATLMAAAGDDATALLANADFSQGYKTGWTIDCTASATDFRIVDGNTFSMKATGLTHSDLYQKLTTLPNGTYRVSAGFKTLRSSLLKKHGCPDGYSWIGLYASPEDGDTCRSDNVVGRLATISSTTGTFATYSVCTNVTNHQLTLGVRSDKADYYLLTDVQVEMVDPEAHRADVACGHLYHDLTTADHQALEYDLTAPLYADANDVDLTTGGFVQQPNALVTTTHAGMVKEVNEIVDGTCQHLAITDGAPFHTTSEFTATTVTYNRDMSDQWGTIVLPYPVQSNDSVQFYTLRYVVSDGEDATMYFLPAERLEAGTPGIFATTLASPYVIGFNAEEVTVCSAITPVATDDVAEWTLDATFQPVARGTLADSIYVMTDDSFTWAAADTTLHPFRAWFAISPDYEACLTPAFRLAEFTDDVVGIATSEAKVRTDRRVFTLSGMHIPSGKALKPGIYIIDKKKIMSNE